MAKITVTIKANSVADWYVNVMMLAEHIISMKDLGLKDPMIKIEEAMDTVGHGEFLNHFHYEKHPYGSHHIEVVSEETIKSNELK